MTLLKSYSISIKMSFFLYILLMSTEEGHGESRYETGGLTKTGNGEKHLKQIMQYGKHPRYGKCWTRALEHIKEGCKNLTDDEQSIMALRLTNCHLEKAGLRTYPCDPSQNIQDCSQQLKGDVIAFNAYTVFFTHTHDMCYSLRIQVWQEQTEITVSRLAKSSEEVAVKMEATGQLQEEMKVKQEESLEQQRLILENEEHLRQTLETSSNDIKSDFAEMKQSTQNQRHLLEKTFSRIADVQHMILGEFSWFNSLLFFAAAVLIAYLLTSAPRTSGARLWLFIILGANFVIERLVFQMAGADQTQLYERMWLCRYCFCFAALVTLLIVAYRYKDFAVVNNQMLLEIKQKIEKIERQHLELIQVLKSGGRYPAIGDGVVAAASQSTSTTAMSLLSSQKQKSFGAGFDCSDSIPARNADGMTMLDGYSSEYFTGTDSDPTFIEGGSSDAEPLDTESFLTARTPSQPTSRRASFNEGHPAADHGYNQSFNQSVSTLTSSESTDGTFTGSSMSSAKRKRGRPKGSRSKQSTPQNVTPTQSRYNLRTRGSPVADNSILNSETVQAFMERMGVSLGRREYRVEQLTPVGNSRRRGNVTSFSSDEEY
ncbi:uncharacterized protein [Asterias amurensis]|uniref:uncharacterized protein n=1 Tax=Asterias amurensis TaxID=7602 RepID=UPI003AB5F333